MSPRKVNPELADRRREVLERAGYAEILDKGIESTTLDSVVARAGSSKGGALYYFPTKEDLLFGVLDWLLRQLDRSLDEVVHTSQPAKTRLSAELEVLFHSAEVNRKFYLVFFDFVGRGARSERFRTLFAGFLERARARDTRIIEDGIREQEFRKVHPPDAARTIRALVDGYCLQWLMNPDDAPVESYRDRCGAVLGAYLLR
jgi:TetR/AcrR family transcriptional regulator, fatty acid metabolism regulator protein